MVSDRRFFVHDSLQTVLAIALWMTIELAYPGIGIIS
jgi:hypothetical protein